MNATIDVRVHNEVSLHAPIHKEARGNNDVGYISNMWEFLRTGGISLRLVSSTLLLLHLTYPFRSFLSFLPWISLTIAPLAIYNDFNEAHTTRNWTYYGSGIV